MVPAGAILQLSREPILAAAQGEFMLKRLAFLAYGVACYVLFLGTFLYAIGFIGGFGVPKSLDGIPTAPPASRWPSTRRCSGSSPSSTA